MTINQFPSVTPYLIRVSASGYPLNTHGSRESRCFYVTHHKHGRRKRTGIFLKFI